MDYFVTISDGNTEVLSLTVRVFNGYELRVKCYDTFANIIAEDVDSVVHKEVPFYSKYDSNTLTVTISESSSTVIPGLDLRKLTPIPLEPRVTKEDLTSLNNFIDDLHRED